MKRQHLLPSSSSSKIFFSAATTTTTTSILWLLLMLAVVPTTAATFVTTGSSARVVILQQQRLLRRHDVGVMKKNADWILPTMTQQQQEQQQQDHHHHPVPSPITATTASHYYDEKRTRTTTIMQLRGGGGAISAATVTARVCATFLGMNGLLLVIAPGFVMKDLYKILVDDDPKQVLSKDLLHAIGSVTLGMAMLIGLTLLSIRPHVERSVLQLERVIGLSLIPRLVVFGSKLRRYPTKMLITNTVITAFAITSMLTGRGAVASRVFPTMSLAKALFLRWRPKEACQKFFGLEDIHDNDLKQSKALVRALSNELLTTSVFMLLLVGIGGGGIGAPKMAPSVAAGWISILWIVLLVDMAFVDKTWQLMGAKGPLAQIIHIIISTGLAAGFFLRW